ncbi:50S ribosomal protein [Hyphomonas hirschiana VP5]|nr:50S ribosomal protein [Hyphomonas hirschiana VP5]
MTWERISQSSSLIAAVDRAPPQTVDARLQIKEHLFFGARPMSRECELTGTKPMVGNIVSHSQIKTKRRYLPNLVQVTLRSEALDQNFRMRIAAKALRTVDKLGGLDAFLAKAKEEGLSTKALKIKRDIAKKAVA